MNIYHFCECSLHSHSVHHHTVHHHFIISFLLLLLQGFFLRFEVLNEISFARGFLLQVLGLRLKVFDELRIGLLAIRRNPGVLDLCEFGFLRLDFLLQGFDGLVLARVILLQLRLLGSLLLELFALPSELCYRLLLILRLLQQDDVPALSLCHACLHFRHLLLHQIETLRFLHQAHQFLILWRCIHSIFLLLFRCLGRRQLLHSRYLFFQICLFCFILLILSFQRGNFFFQIFHQRFPLRESESQVYVSLSAWTFHSCLRCQELVPEYLQLVII